MILPLLAVAGSPNLPSVEMVELMSTKAKLLSLGSNTPTPSALRGAKMILPLLAVAAPKNFESVEMVELMSTRAKLLSLGSNTPTPSAFRAKDDLAVARSHGSIEVTICRNGRADVHQREVVCGGRRQFATYTVRGFRVAVKRGPRPAVLGIGHSSKHREKKSEPDFQQNCHFAVLLNFQQIVMNFQGCDIAPATRARKIDARSQPSVRVTRRPFETVPSLRGPIFSRFRAV